MTSALESEVRARVFPEIDRLMEEAGTRSDADRLDDWADRIAELFRATRSAIEPVIGRTQQLMLTLGDVVEERATNEQVAAIRAVLGVSPRFYDADRISGILNAWKRQNEAFITRMADDAVQSMMDTASRAVRSGRPNREVRAELRNRFDISDRRARTIARTEISQLNAQITRERQREVGITSYTWLASSDERVRDEHEELDGQEVEWDNPPALANGNHAGEEINCRCSARGNISGLLEQLEDI